MNKLLKEKSNYIEMQKKIYKFLKLFVFDNLENK
jgi:hypothetical protein